VLGWNDTNPHRQKNKLMTSASTAGATVWEQVNLSNFFAWHPHDRTDVLTDVPGGHRAPHNPVWIPSQFTELGIEWIAGQ